MKNLKRKQIGYVVSKVEKGECKNDDCQNPRREASAYCQSCSDKHKQK